MKVIGIIVLLSILPLLGAIVNVAAGAAVTGQATTQDALNGAGFGLLIVGLVGLLLGMIVVGVTLLR